MRARAPTRSPTPWGTLPTYTISTYAGPGGTISPVSPVVAQGSDKTFTITPKVGYHITSLVIDGTPINPSSSYTFWNVTKSHTISAVFALNTYQLKYTAGTGGSISGSATQVVAYGSSGARVTAVPATGYRFVRWSDGSTSASRTDSNVHGNLTVAASFAKSTSISLTAPATSDYASAKLYGYLKYGSGSALAGKPVAIEQYVGSGAWKKIATATTTSSGYFTYTAKPTVKTAYRARYLGDSVYNASATSSRWVLPKVRLSRTSSLSTLTYAKTYYATGYIEPRHYSTSGKVRIYAYKRASNGTYYYKASYAAAYSYYSATKTRYKAGVKLPSKGAWKLVAYHAADSSNAATWGSADYLTVK